MMVSNHKILYALLTFSLFWVGVCIWVCERANSIFNPKIICNYESGFYDEPIEVKVEVGSNYYVTYTLDGRAPNAACTRYEGPIRITDASENDNVWSMIDETSLRYFESDYYMLPNYKVDKCVVLRMAAFDYQGNQVCSDTREYFIGFNEKTGYKDMYNLCVVTDPENFFDIEKGAYSVGSYFARKIENGAIYEMYSDEYGWKNEDKVNWAKTGRKNERAATIELFNPMGQLVIRERCGARIRGGESRYSVQKPLGFYAREEYSGHDRFSTLLPLNRGGTIGLKNFIIHNSGDDFEVKLIDFVIYNALLNGKMSFAVSPIIPCNLFIDGEYWGPMYLMRDTNCYTIGDDYGVDAENVVVIKSGDSKVAGDDTELLETENLDEWNKLLEFIRCHDMSDQDNYEYVCSQIDIENLVDYAATEIYIANADWHIKNNSAFWRTLKQETGNNYADGKWRCSLYDVNLSFESEEKMRYEHEQYIHWDLCDMVHDLCKNDEFKKLYLEKLEELEVLFAPDKVQDIIDEWSSVMEEPIRCHFKRFGIAADADEMINEEKKKVLDFCINRPEEMKKVNEWMFR